MKKKLLLFILTFSIIYIVSAQTTRTITWDATTREYIENIPASYDGSTTAPVLFCLHGLDDTMENFNQLGFTSIAENWIVITPQALLDTMQIVGDIGFAWNSGAGWVGFPFIGDHQFNADVDDSGFIMAILDSLENNLNINTDSIFVMGYSVGGHMANRIATEHSDRITSIASVSGTIGCFFTPEPSSNVNTLHIHGTADSNILYDNGNLDSGAGNLPAGMGAEECVEFWRNHNNCMPIPIVYNYPDIVEDEKTFEKSIYVSGDNNSYSVLIKAIGGEHEWYSTPQDDIDCTLEIYKFFIRTFDDQFMAHFSWSDTQCSGNAITFTDASIGGSVDSWEWYINGSLEGSTSTLTYNFPTVTVPTSFDVMLIVGSGPESSEITYSITIYPLPTVTIAPVDTTICEGASITLMANGADTYTWNTSDETDSITATIFNNTTYSVIGTDSTYGCINTAEVDVYVNNIDTTVIDQSFCEGDSYNFHGIDLEIEDTYFHTLVSINTGCDSIIQLNLTENPIYFIEETQSICQGETFLWQGTEYSETGIFNAEYSCIVTGCDSIYQLDLEVYPAYEFITTESICEGDEFEWRGNVYTEENTYEENYLTVGTSCDSIYLLDLTVSPPPQQVEVLTNPSNGIIEPGNTGEISLSTSYTGTDYWVTMGGTNFNEVFSGNGTGLSLGTNYPAGTFDIWSQNEYGCVLLLGYVTFIEDNGNNNLTTNITYGTPATNFPSGEVVVSLYSLTTDVEMNEVITLDQVQTLGNNGQVIFEDIEPGDYFLGSALVNPNNYDVAEHIYYQTSISHEDAISIPMTESTIFIADIHHPQLSAEEGSNSGEGVVGEGSSKSELNPLENIVVIIKDIDADEIIDVTVTNSIGEFSFPFIPDNTNIQMYVSSFEHQDWTPYSALTVAGLHYYVNFIVDGNEVYPEETLGSMLHTAAEVNIYPNPTTGQINIEAQNITNIAISNLEGRIILSKKIDCNTTQLDLNKFSKGMYLIKVETTNGFKIEKIVIE